MSLQDRLDAVKADFISKVPADVRAIMDGVTHDLAASGQVERALGVGDHAPDFALPDTDGRIVRSSDVLRRGPLVLTFYRGVWCPYCNLDLQALEEASKEILATGASLLAVSQQTAPNSRKAQRDNSLGYPVLRDQGGLLAEEFGIRWTFPDALKAIYRQIGVDLPAFNGDEAWTLPMPARYVIGRDGVIVHADVNPDYTIRPELLRKLATESHRTAREPA